MNLESKWLEDFLALAELRNFSRAAEFRNITQPAFGRRIRSLEQMVGFELVERGTVPIDLTPEGRLFRTTARNLLRQMEEGLTQLRGQAETQAIDFAAAHSLSVTLLPELIDQMSSENRALRTRVESIDVDLAIEALKEGSCDFLLAFNAEALMQPPFEYLPLGMTRLFPVCLADESGQPVYTADHGEDIPLLSYSPDAFMGRKVNHLLRSSIPDFRFQTIMESSLTNLLKVMTLKGKGVAWLPDYSIRRELESGQLVPFTDQAEWAGQVEIVIYRNNVRLHASAENLWAQLKSKCRQGWSLT
ncbi:LysR substrate-binding domain-containing protein [Endozoicomonas arenosclerae]|uniref:LysR substrate-binding domain-containing protein n=1 Tax=Endozoicomonas arenosclerae TaxID=1633495 RepID=UPI00078628C3|nr:LysR substrate-binding domain-containing protein [Endozoicomonas arenosclerae]